MTDKSRWMTSQQITNRLAEHRDNDVKVLILGHDFAVTNVYYHRTADTIFIEIDEQDENYQDLQWAQPSDDDE